MAHHIPKIEYGDFVPTVISFDYPPVEKSKEKIRAQNKVSTSLSGQRQVQNLYMEGSRTLEFRFLSENLKDSLETFFTSHAGKGKAFKYYDDKTSGDYVSYELANDDFDPKVIASVTQNTYIYAVELELRRVIGETQAENYMEITLANNQSSAADVTGLLLDSSSYRSARIEIEIFRKTDSAERIFRGHLIATYLESSGAWDITPSGEGSGQYESGVYSHGVTFSITAAGQVQYTSDLMTGLNYEGELILRNFVITE